MNFWKVAPLDSAVDGLEMRHCSEAYRSAHRALVFTDELTSFLEAFFSRAREQDAVSWTNCTNWTMFLGSDGCGPADGCGPVQEKMCSVASACTSAGIVLFDPPACPAGLGVPYKDDHEEQICLIHDGRGVGEDGHDEGQNHDQVERSPSLSRNQQKFSRGVIGQDETATELTLEIQPCGSRADTKPSGCGSRAEVRPVRI